MTRWTIREQTYGGGGGEDIFLLLSDALDGFGLPEDAVVATEPLAPAVPRLSDLNCTDGRLPCRCCCC